MRPYILLYLLFVGMTLTSCQEDTSQSARQILQTFCSLHRAEIFNTLLTEEQRASATVVCYAIGMRLGSDAQ